MNASRTDPELAAAFVRGDESAGEELIERHYDGVVRFFRTKTNDAVDDLVQKTFLVCMDRLHTYSGAAPFRAFLFGIARNVLFELLRGKRRDAQGSADVSQSSIVDLSPGVHTLAFRRAEQRRVVRALQSLPLDLQILLELHYWEEMGLAELATLLEVPEGTVKSRLFRARQVLREALESSGSTGEPTSVDSLEGWAERLRGERPSVADDSREGSG